MTGDDVPFSRCSWPALPPPRAVALITLPTQPCPYLPAQQATSRAFLGERIPSRDYHRFMNAGFRRSGQVIYQPVCRGCRACVPLRVPVARFHPSRSQRRCWRRNQDLRPTLDTPRCTDEKHDLYRRYLAARHDGAMSDHREGFEAFLYQSPVQTVECCYRDAGGRLLAVGLCDLHRDGHESSLSSVYFFYEPQERRRGLGTYGALYEIELARQLGIAWYYLGYWIAGCDTMQYKTGFRPYELLYPDGTWREGREE